MSNFKEENGRFTCQQCGYQLSAMMGDNEIPEHCDCLENDQEID